MGFLLEYLKNPRFIGAVAPSGINLSRRMIRPINFKTAKVIVEYGPGTGSFTRELVVHRNPGTALLLIERNPLFCDELKKLFENQPNIHIINGDAENVSRYLDEHARKYQQCVQVERETVSHVEVYLIALSASAPRNGALDAVSYHTLPAFDIVTYGGTA